jgi:hypothetical protein
VGNDIPTDESCLQVTQNQPCGSSGPLADIIAPPNHLQSLGSDEGFQVQPRARHSDPNTDWLALFPLQDDSQGFQGGPLVLMRAGLASPVMTVRRLEGRDGGASVIAVELCLFHTNFRFQVDAGGNVLVDLEANSASLCGALLFCPPTGLDRQSFTNPAGPLDGELISQVLLVPRSSGDRCAVFAAVAQLGIRAVAAGASVAFTSMQGLGGVVFFLAE